MVEDDDGIRGLVRKALEPAGYEVTEAGDGRGGLRALYEHRPDVVVLDTTLPEIDGWETLERLRDVSDAPVIVLAPFPRYEDVVRALRAGADDVVTKPFHPDELVARVDVLVRRWTPASDGAEPAGPRVFGSLVVFQERDDVHLDGVPVSLTRIEFDILDALSASPHRVLTRHEIINTVWGPAWVGDEHLIDTHVSKLRRKLGDDPRAPRFIETVRGVGFRMAPVPESGNLQGSSAEP